MSQGGNLGTGGSGGGGITTLTGDTGSATGSSVEISGGTTGFTFVASGAEVVLTGSGGGTGNVISDGTAGPTQFALYTTDAFHVTTSSLTEVSGKTAYINSATNFRVGTDPSLPIFLANINGAVRTTGNTLDDGNGIMSLNINHGVHSNQFQLNDSNGNEFWNVETISGGSGIHTFFGGQVVNYTTTSGNYDILTTDYIIGCSVGNLLITLPAVSDIITQIYTVKDESGTALMSNITINTSDTSNIDGSSSYVIMTNYGSVSFYQNGTQWFSF